MNMVYTDDTLFVDLSGEVDLKNFKRKLFSVLEIYPANNVVISVTDVFNYKKRDYENIKEDYKRVYKGVFKIEK